MPRGKRPAPEPDFVPFADDATVRTIGGLSLENGTTRIAIHGSFDLTCDRLGLQRAKQLRDLFDAIVSALDTADLPDRVAEETHPTTLVRNPFA